MKKIVIPTLILLYISANAGMFDDNTDMKKKYEFDSTTEAKNEKMKEVLSRFQDSQVLDDEIQTYLESRENSQVVPFEKDIEIDSELLREIDIKDREEKPFSFPFFGDDTNTSVVVEEETTPIVEEETAPVAEEETTPIVVEEETAPVAEEETTPIVVEEETAPVVVEEETSPQGDAQ